MITTYRSVRAVLLFIIIFGLSGCGGDSSTVDVADSSSVPPKNQLAIMSGSYGNDRGNSIAVDSAGNIVVAGYTEGSFDSGIKMGNSDLLLVKYDKNGSKMWSTQLGVTGAVTKATGVAIDGASNVYVTGYTEGELDGHITDGNREMFLVKFTPQGVKLWSRLLGETYASTEAHGVAVDSDSSVYVTGFSSKLVHPYAFDGNPFVGDTDTFLVKYRSNGDKVWSKLLGASSSYTGFPKTIGNGIAVDSSSNIYITGWTTGQFDANDSSHWPYSSVFNAKFDVNGNLQWAKTFGSGTVASRANGVAADNQGNTYIAGYNYNSHASLLLLKFDSNGNVQWSKEEQTATSDAVFQAVAVDASGNVYPTGYTQVALDGNIVTGVGDIVVVKYGPNGDKKWQKQLGFSGVFMAGYGCAVGPESLYVTGSAYSHWDLTPSVVTSGTDMIIAGFDLSSGFH
ncbi:SBBP repeat-containing protein [Geobacter benzoatilyticus]|jgi:hypothetical protein|uniref:SBBP repeat-containing protein n=1 Tax=Geobacter benzoatilyticus TaxID=2815309 RepID=A0ABX7Q583_9BACT|nr:SBBP repeat-containing protein [Geobacter benzoatilyticus]QSV46223.1 SBBP repeat-containing protein [Geobacter benzoatilyticus]